MHRPGSRSCLDNVSSMVVAQLVAYREGVRNTDADYGGMMRGVASRLTDTEIRAVANYIQGLY